MLRKLFTRPIWWWERNRSYSVRSRYSELPPLAVSQGPARFVVLTTPEHVTDAIWAAWSWYRYLRHKGFELRLAVDGQITESGMAAARGLFPGIVIYEVLPTFHSLLGNRPALSRFIGNHPLGKKLGLVLALSEQGTLLFSDYDVLALNEPTELLSYSDKNMPCYMTEEHAESIDSEIAIRSKSLGLTLEPKFNSGLLFIPHRALSIDLAEQILADWNPPSNSWFTEQTVLNILMQAANARALPVGRYVVNVRRQFYWQADVDYGAIAARHFISPVRHVMYINGIPAILRQSQNFTDGMEKERSVNCQLENCK